MKKLSVKTKIAIWVSALVLITALISSAAVVFFGNQVTQNAMKRNLISAVEGNINELEILSRLDRARLDDEFDILVEGDGFFVEIDDDFIKSTNGINTTLYGGGSVLYGDGAAGTDIAPFSNTGIRRVHTADGDWFIYDKRIKSDLAKELWLRGAVPVTEGFTQTLNVIDSYLLLVPLMVLLAVLGALVISRRSLKPIDDVCLSANEIRHGNDLTKRLEIENKGAEIDALVSSFNAMLERLESSFERERRFSSDISHELRTPISVIRSAAELALDENDAEQYAESLDMIKRQSEKMSAMINEMLEYSRLGNGAAKAEEVDFSGLLNDLCGDLALLKTNGITLETEIESEVKIFAVPSLITRLCENLIQNAFKYGNENGRVLVSLKRDNGFAVLSVKDNGVGIKAEDKDKIFDVFYRADESRSREGFGLGLSFVKRIAELHGGEINVNSIEGMGSEFTYCQKLFEKTDSLMLF